MTVFVRVVSSSASPADCVPAILGLPDRSADLRVEKTNGSPVVGRVTNWWRWSVADDVPPIRVASILDEGDPDDAPFDTPGGLLAEPVGCITSYVFALREMGHTAELDGRVQVMQCADSDLFAPRESPDAPLPPVLLELARRLQSAMNGHGLAKAAQNDVYLEFGTGNGSVRHFDGGFAVSVVLEVPLHGTGLDEPSRAPSARRQAAEALHQVVAPPFELCGFEYAGPPQSIAHEGNQTTAVGVWSRLVPTVEAAVTLVREVAPLDLCGDVQVASVVRVAANVNHGTSAPTPDMTN